MGGHKNSGQKRGEKGRGDSQGDKMIPLSRLKRGQSGRIAAFRGSAEAAFRFMEMGLAEGESARLLERLPFGGNLVVLLENGKYTIRKKDADLIIVEISSPAGGLL